MLIVMLVFSFCQNLNPEPSTHQPLAQTN